MTIKEAIIELEDFLNSPIGDGDLHMESVEVALDALCEQAEREKGCEFCCYTEYPEKQLYPKRDYLFYAGYSKQIKVDEFDEFETEEINYCPMCGKKLKEV